jgi:hypothetical protein
VRVIPTKYVSDDDKIFETEEACRAHEDQVIRLGMKQWMFSYQYHLELRSEYVDQRKTCSHCNGTGHVHRGWADDDDVCKQCDGAGSILVKKGLPSLPAPPIPQGLQEAMLKAWTDWWAEYKSKNP